IIEMPKYLKKYATEFNYLFECIYKCSQISNPKNENYHILYNFANNARKFLEIYLYYQYPTISNNNEESKFEKFFGAGQIPSFLNRINNEYSHLDGGLERGAMPIDFSEAQICAKAILDTIEKRNPEQFKALKESIGCK
ncbi:AAA family ATPase, partial [Bisgaard Taxon 45]